jgi:hypothetical protein
MEAEYIALSSAMRVFIPVRRLYFEVLHTLSLPIDEKSFISTVWEDNQAALLLANSNDPPRLTPRSKHIAIKYHWFRSHLSPNSIVVRHVSTNDQMADILTKPLARTKFEAARKLIMGW